MTPMLMLLAACAGPVEGPGPEDVGPTDDADSGAITDGDGGDSGTTGDSGDPAVDSGATGGDTGDAPLPLEVVATRSEANPLSAIVELRAPVACAPIIDVMLDGERIAGASDSVEATRHELVVYGLTAGREHQLVARCGDAAGEVAVRTDGILDGMVRPFFVDRRAPLDGLVALPNGNGPFDPDDVLAFAVDEHGAVRWMYRTDDGFRHADVELEYLGDGSIKIMTPAWVRRVDMAGRILAELRAEDIHEPGFHHDAVALDGGGWLVLAHDDRVVRTEGGIDEHVLGDRLLRVDPTGEVVWRWSTFEHLDPTERGELPPIGSGTEDEVDWTHANTVEWVEDPGGWLLNLRNLHRIILIDPDSGDIRWTFGVDQDFTLEKGSWFYGAHAPTWDGDDGLLVYDNGLGRPGEEPYSRVVAYTLDPDAGVAWQTWSHELPAFSATQGDVDRLPDGRLLVLSGAVEEGEEFVARARVLDDDGELGWQIDLATIAYRVEWLPLD